LKSINGKKFEKIKAGVVEISAILLNGSVSGPTKLKKYLAPVIPATQPWIKNNFRRLPQ
jgi:hypothetical protein